MQSAEILAILAQRLKAIADIVEMLKVPDPLARAELLLHLGSAEAAVYRMLAEQSSVREELG